VAARTTGPPDGVAAGTTGARQAEWPLVPPARLTTPVVANTSTGA